MIQKLASLLYLLFSLSLYQSLTLLCRKFGHCKYLILFFFLAILLEIFLLAWDHRPVSSPKFSVALALRQTASHLTLKYFCKARSSWSIQWLQGDCDHHHHHVSTVFDSLYEVVVLMCCVCFLPNTVLCITIPTLCIMTKHLPSQESCGFFSCNVANLSCAAMFFLKIRGFFLPSKQNLFTFF